MESPTIYYTCISHTRIYMHNNISNMSSSSGFYSQIDELADNGDNENEELVDDFQEGNMVAKLRSAIWSPPGNYLDESPHVGESPHGSLLGNQNKVSLTQTVTDEERRIKQERRKLRRRRSSSFVIVPSRLTTATFNLTNTIMGSGTLAMPYACLNSGLGLFPLLVIMTAIGSHYAIICLFKAVTQLNLSRPRYPTLGRATMGIWGEFVSSWVVTLQQFGACIAFIIIIADVLFPVISQIEGYPMLCQRWFLQIAIVVGIIFPLCLIPSMDKLKYASLLSLILICTTVLVVIGNGIYVMIEGDVIREKLINTTLIDDGQSTLDYCSSILNPASKPQHHNNSNSNGYGDFMESFSTSTIDDSVQILPRGLSFLSALPILAFAFLCHMNTFPIYRELERRSVRRMGMVSRRSMFVVASAYTLTGVFGYFTFLSYTEDDLLKNFKVKGTYISFIMNIVRVGFGISMILSFPLMIWEARHNLDVLLFTSSKSSNKKRKKYSFKRFMLLNVILLTIQTTVAILAPGIAPVIELIGSTCSPLMMYILPALFVLKSSGNATNANTGMKSWCKKEFAGELILLFIGLTLIPLCLFIWIMKYLVCNGGIDDVGTVKATCSLLFPSLGS